MIVDGKKIAAEILALTKERASKLPRPPKVVAVVASETPATRSYLKIKAARAADAGCDFEIRKFPASFDDADAVIIQLPLPEGVDTKAALDSIPIEKDADVLSSAARERFARGDRLLPPVVAAMEEILKVGGVDLEGKKTVVIGRGWLVGEPAAQWLRQKGAAVTVLNSKSENLSAVLLAADLIVSGAGSPHLIKPEYLKQGVVLIDAGTSESGGALVGDAEPSCSAKCSLFTPVPGGVGPIAVACLFSNAVTLAERK